MKTMHHRPGLLSMGTAHSLRRAAGFCALMGLVSLSTGCLNPEFLNQATAAYYPKAPGQEPYLLVRVINNSSATIDFPVIYDDGVDEQVFYFWGIDPEFRDAGVLLDWPVFRVALGYDLDNPYIPSIVATLPDGTISTVPFGMRALEASVDYERGDAVVFVIENDARSEAAVSVSAGLIKGQDQGGLLLRADPFEAVSLILELNGF